jgi:hypothetical protein
MAAVPEIQKGFYVGLGVAAALAVWALLQMFLSKAAGRG